MTVARQQEVLEATVEMGYVMVPREMISEDLAADLGVAPATVREHLQRAQRNVFTFLN